MIGFPWDTHQTVRETLNFMREVDGDFADVFVAYPFEGTPLRDTGEDEGLLSLDPRSGSAYAKAVVRTHTLTPDELSRYRRWGLLRFYARPRYVLRRLRTAESPTVMLSYMGHGVRLLRTLLRPRRA